MKGNCIYSASPAYETLPTNRSAYDRDTLQFRHGGVPPCAALLFNEPCRSIIHNFFLPFPRNSIPYYILSLTTVGSYVVATSYVRVRTSIRSPSSDVTRLWRCIETIESTIVTRETK